MPNNSGAIILMAYLLRSDYPGVNELTIQAVAEDLCTPLDGRPITQEYIDALINRYQEVFLREES